MGVENWNKAQSAGDIKTTKRLVNQQWISELLFGRIFRSNVSKYLKAHPETALVIDTQAQNTHQILRAVSDYNQKTGKEVQFLKRMTDLPNKADHFFLSLKKIRSQDVKYLTLEMPHAPGELKENVPQNLEYYRTKCPNLFDKNGSAKCTFTFTDGPIKQPFKAILEAKQNPAELENLVPKNTNMTVRMKVKQNDAVLTQNFTIDAHATVKSIMLGSQAAVAGTLAYVSAEVDAYTTQSKPEYLFVFCGNNADLFKQVQAKAEAAKEKHDHLTIVPLINQDAEMIAQVYGRADTVILRAGGISCMEIEAAARPGATIFFHSEGTSDDEAVLAENLIPWEAGNIEHVKATLRPNNNMVKIIRPQMYTQELALALAKQAAPLMASSRVKEPRVARRTHPVRVLAEANSNFTTLEAFVKKISKEPLKNIYHIADYKRITVGDVTQSIELSFKDALPHKAYIQPTLASAEQGGVTYSIDNGLSPAKEKKIIKNLCKLAVDAALTTPQAEFDLTNTPENKRDKTKNALIAAIEANQKVQKYSATNPAPIIKEGNTIVYSCRVDSNNNTLKP